MPTAQQLLDLEVARRASTFRFALLDRDLNEIGDLKVADGPAPTIENNSNRAIKRTLSGLVLDPSQVGEIDPLTHRVRVSMILGEVAYPLGVFLFSGFDRTVKSFGTVPAPTMHDQGVILDQGMPRSWSNSPGTLVTDSLERLLADLPLPAGWEIEASSTRVSTSAAMSWPAGTTRSKILNETAAVAGFYSGFFDNSGVLRYQSPPSLGVDDPATHDYRTDINPSRILSDSIVLSDDLLDAPNRYIVVDSAGTETPVVGVFDVPDEAPQSAANRGYVVARVYDAQGVGSTAQANAMAKRYFLSGRSFEWLTFEGANDPRHDTFDTVNVLGQVYREASWSMRLSSGGSMTHQLRRTYGV